MGWDSAPPDDDLKNELAWDASPPDEDLMTSGPSLLKQAGNAIRGGVQGLSLSFGDEAQGGLEAAGQAVGIKGLGANSFDQLGFQSPKIGNPSELMDVYRQTRDEARHADKIAESENPVGYGASNLGGAVATSFVPGLGALNAAKGAKLGATVGKAALGGGVTGLGNSEADLTNGDVAGAAIDTGIGAGLGAGFGAAGYGIQNTVLPAAKQFGSYLGEKADDARNYLNPKIGKIGANIPEDVTQKYYANSANYAPENVKDLPQLKEIIDQNSDVLSRGRDVAKESVGNIRGEFKSNPAPAGLIDDIIGGAKKLKDQITKGSSEAYDILDNDPQAYGVRSAGKILRKMADDMNIQAFDQSAGSTNALAAVGSDLGSAAAGPTPITSHAVGIQNELRSFANMLENTPEKLPARELKKILQQIDRSEKAMYGQPGFDDQVAKAYKLVRGNIDDVIKKNNKPYEKKMDEVSRKTGLYSELTGRFKNPRMAQSRIPGLTSGKGSMDADLLNRLNQETGVDVVGNLNRYRSGYESRISGAEDLHAAAEAAYRETGVTQAGSEPLIKRFLSNRPSIEDQARVGRIGQDLPEEIDKLRVVNSFEKGDTQGSRKTLMGALTGKAIQSAVGGAIGYEVGGDAGALAGGAAGFSADRYAGRMFKAFLDGQIAADKAMPVLARSLGKFAKPLMDAASRGNKSLGATHFILQQTNPDYRRQIMGLSDEQD